MTFDYGSTGNNGNLLSQTIAGTGLSLTATQTYQYHQLNLLKSATEGTAWSRGFNFDQYGNGWVSAATGISASSATPQSQSAYDTSTNRMNGNGWDAAGNETSVGAAGYTYDAENRMTKSQLEMRFQLLRQHGGGLSV